MMFISGWIKRRKARKQAEAQKSEMINNLHKNLNTAVMRMQVIIRADDDKTRSMIAHEAMGNIRRAKHDLAGLGMDYQG